MAKKKAETGKKTKYPGVEKLGPQLYRVRVSVRCPRTGKRRERDRHVEGNLRDAVAEREVLRAELIDPAPERTTLTAFAQRWLKTKRDVVRASTLKIYMTHLENHILPALGDFYVDQIRPSDVIPLIARGRGAPSSRVVRLQVLRQLAADAVADGLRETSFTARVRPPQVPRRSEEDPNLLTAGDLGKLLGYVREHLPRWYPIVLLQATTGLRWAELTGLRWEDLDPEAGVIRVRRNNWRGQIHETKTEGSRRVVPLLPDVWEALKTHRRWMIERQAPGLESGWVFVTRTGGLYRGCPLNKHFPEACRKLGIPEVTTHGFRRTANNLIRQTSSSLVAKALLGHVSDAMHERYSMVEHQEKVEAAATVFRLVQGGGGDRGGDRDPEGALAEREKVKKDG